MPLSVDLAIAPGDDLIARCAEHILQHHGDALPDLGQIAVVLPDHSGCTQFRSQCLEQLERNNIHAVIPPWCGTLRERMSTHTVQPRTLISEHSRRLLFIEALEQHSQLFREENKWQVSIALLKLFDELNLQQITITENSADWEQRIQLGYGLENSHSHLQQEAALVHTLWHAWHRQLDDSQQIDTSLAYVEALANIADKNYTDNTYYYFVSTAGYSNAELDCIALLQQQQRCSVIDIDASIKSQHPAWQFIHNTFDYTAAPLQSRVKIISSAARLPCSVFLATSADTETRAVDVQIRRWLLEGCKNIGVVCQDRKLSRRLRALLERAHVPLNDMAGWSLATTSAAAVLERWLECIETDFDYRAFLDVVKSHFLVQENREHHLKNIYRLEHDIILHEKIGHGLERYKKQLKYRLDRLPHWPSKSYDEIGKLLDGFETIAAPLQALYRSNSKHALSQYLDALMTSLAELGIKQSFNDDAAGQCILQTLDDMRSSIHTANPSLHWQDFRNWLGMAFEEQLFSPHTEASVVQLMTLEQSALKKFDALVIAAADEQHLPGHADSSPFFNQAVRLSLGLPVWEQQCEQRLLYFKQLLLSSKEVLITCKSHDNGEAVPLSPWIEALRVHHQLCFDQSMDNTEIAQLLALSAEVRTATQPALPQAPARPDPAAPLPLIPIEISASAHQRLINCPYQYFAADILALKPAEEISEELQKSDYGNRVHQILQAFHQDVAHLPAAFAEALTQTNRAAAITHLAAISEIVFARDQQNNILHRSWLHRWLDHVPAYIDWQIGQQQHWQVQATELKCEYKLDDMLVMHGRLDRIDQSSDGQMIIDYKTGRTARQADVDSGEDVQLVSYAMLNDNATTVAYVALDAPGAGVKTAALLQDEQLEDIKHDCSQRLVEIYRLMRQQHPLIAWGDDDTCGYCNFRGLCRKDFWNTSA